MPQTPQTQQQLFAASQHHPGHGYGVQMTAPPHPRQQLRHGAPPPHHMVHMQPPHMQQHHHYRQQQQHMGGAVGGHFGHASPRQQPPPRHRASFSTPSPRNSSQGGGSGSSGGSGSARKSGSSNPDAASRRAAIALEHFEHRARLAALVGDLNRHEVAVIDFLDQAGTAGVNLPDIVDWIKCRIAADGLRSVAELNAAVAKAKTALAAVKAAETAALLSTESTTPVRPAGHVKTEEETLSEGQTAISAAAAAAVDDDQRWSVSAMHVKPGLVCAAMRVFAEYEQRGDRGSKFDGFLRVTGNRRPSRLMMMLKGKRPRDAPPDAICPEITVGTRIVHRKQGTGTVLQVSRSAAGRIKAHVKYDSKNLMVWMYRFDVLTGEDTPTPIIYRRSRYSLGTRLASNRRVESYGGDASGAASTTTPTTDADLEEYDPTASVKSEKTVDDENDDVVDEDNDAQDAKPIRRSLQFLGGESKSSAAAAADSSSTTSISGADMSKIPAPQYAVYATVDVAGASVSINAATIAVNKAAAENVPPTTPMLCTCIENRKDTSNWVPYSMCAAPACVMLYALAYRTQRDAGIAATAAGTAAGVLSVLPSTAVEMPNIAGDLSGLLDFFRANESATESVEAGSETNAKI